MESHTPHSPQSPPLSPPTRSILFSFACFWLVVAYNISNQQPSEANVYYIVGIFLSINLTVQTMGRPVPLALCQLSGWLWCRIIKWQPPKANATPIALFFGGVCVGAPNKGASWGEREPAAGRLQRTRKESQCLDLRPWWMLPWQ